MNYCTNPTNTRQEIVADIKRQIEILAQRRADMSIVVRQEIVARVLGQLGELEEGLARDRRLIESRG